MRVYACNGLPGISVNDRSRQACLQSTRRLFDTSSNNPAAALATARVMQQRPPRKKPGRKPKRYRFQPKLAAAPPSNPATTPIASPLVASADADDSSELFSTQTHAPTAQPFKPPHPSSAVAAYTVSAQSLLPLPAPVLTRTQRRVHSADPGSAQPLPQPPAPIMIFTQRCVPIPLSPLRAPDASDSALPSPSTARASCAQHALPPHTVSHTVTHRSSSSAAPAASSLAVTNAAIMDLCAHPGVPPLRSSAGNSEPAAPAEISPAAAIHHHHYYHHHHHHYYHH